MRNTGIFVVPPLSPEQEERARLANLVFDFHGEVNKAVSRTVEAIQSGADALTEMEGFRLVIEQSLAECVKDCAGGKDGEDE